MKKLLAIILAVVMVLSLAACGGGGAEPTKKPVTYPKHMGKLDDFPGGVSYEFYDWNEVAEGKVYGIEYVPAGFNKESGEKLPMVICIHGAGGNEQMLAGVARQCASDGIAAITFGCRGAAKNTKSDDGSASMTSRASDLGTMLDYAKTLPWVDQNKIYFYGESMGGMTIMLSAEYFKDDIAGVLIGASGFSGTGMVDNEFPQYGIQEGQTWQERLLAYEGDYIMFHATGDKTFSTEASYSTYELYKSRNNGAICEFYEWEGGSHEALPDDGKADRALIIKQYILDGKITYTQS